MQFRKKPVVIDAVQWTGKNLEEIVEFMGDDKLGWDLPAGTLSIDTLEGTHKAILNDWVIRGVNGEFYPCKPDIFEKTYEDAAPLPEKTLFKELEIIFVSRGGQTLNEWATHCGKTFATAEDEFQAYQADQLSNLS